MFFKKKKCGLCKINTIPKKPYKVKMKHAEGSITLKICEECEKFLDVVESRVKEFRYD